VLLRTWVAVQPGCRAFDSVQNPDNLDAAHPWPANPLESAVAVIPLSPLDIDVTEPPSPPSPAQGAAQLCFARCGSNTILRRAFATNPLKVLTTRGVSPVCWTYIATYGGGIVGGDAIRLNMEVGSGARGVLLTQASTKVYRSLRPASQHVTASVADEALLVMLPDPVVCFAGAHFSQQQRYELHDRGNLVMVDWITSGRHATGERWAFHHYSSRIDIRRAGRRIVYDALWLDDADGSIGERLGAFDVCLTAVVTGPIVSGAAASIVRAASAAGVEKNANLVAAAWMLPDGGALLRMAGVSAEQVGGALRQRLSFLSELLGDDPWSRKW
jgi:urease accessory protein